MSRTPNLLACAAAAAILAVPMAAQSADPAVVNCSIAIDYTLNGAALQAYRKDFAIQPGVAFTDDFSSTTRSRTFNASVAPEGNNMVVAFDYFNDVDTFDAVSFNARMTLFRGQGIETTSGRQGFSTSLGVAGNHLTSYTLSCRRR